MKAGNPWIHDGPKCGRTYYHNSGYRVQHCGHPTALWPYYIVTPEGVSIYAPNGRAFRLVADAKAAAEQLAAREIPAVVVHYENADRLVALYAGGDYQLPAAMLRAIVRPGTPYHHADLHAHLTKTSR